MQSTFRYVLTLRQRTACDGNIDVSGIKKIINDTPYFDISEPDAAVRLT